MFFFFFFLMGSSSPTPIPFFFFFSSPFFFFFFFRFFFFCRQNNFKISKLRIKFANQSGTHTVPKHATFHPPMHSYHVFHRRVERPSIAGIGCAPEVALKKRRVPLINVKMPTIVGILTFKSRNNFILS